MIWCFFLAHSKLNFVISLLFSHVLMYLLICDLFTDKTSPIWYNIRFVSEQHAHIHTDTHHSCISLIFFCIYFCSCVRVLEWAGCRCCVWEKNTVKFRIFRKFYFSTSNSNYPSFFSLLMAIAYSEIIFVF